MKPGTVSARQGFTLVELLAAITIFSLMAAMIFSIINNTAFITSSATGRMDTNRVARECFDLIGNDLRFAPAPYDNKATLTGDPTYDMTKTSIQLSVSPTGVDSKFCNPHTIFWQSPVARNKNNGNLAVVGYYVLRDLQSNPKNTRLQLRRLYVEPETTPAPTSPKYLIYTQPSNWYPQTLLNEFAPVDIKTDNDNGQKGWIADGILGMWIRCLDAEGKPITKKADGTNINPPYSFDSRNSYRYTDSSSKIRYPQTQSVALPAFIEVALVCCSPKDTIRITGLPTPTAADPLQFYTDVENFAKAVRSQNPQVKSVETFSRKFRIYSTPSL